MARILAIDDDESYLVSLGTFLRLKGHEVTTQTLPPPASEVSGAYDIVLLDIMLGGLDGFLTLDEYCGARIPVAMISGVLDVKNAVRAIRAGAIDVLEKPVDPDRLELLVAMAANKAAADRSERAARASWLRSNFFVGETRLMADLVDAAERVARSGLCILVHGPSGSGKEPLARWIHLCSTRSDRPFVAINCAAVSPDIAESEFFGHRKGSFTGADRERAGCFREANGGTLFLDEVGELPLQLQAKLLRALETGEVRPLGSDAPVRVDVRVISATNRDLRAEVGKGNFREDLLYRLMQVPLSVPPLSSRVADIRGLAEFFLERLGGNGGSADTYFSEDAIAYLRARPFPGNIRELKNLIERAAALSPDRTIGAAFLSGLDSSGWIVSDPAPSGFSFDFPMPLREAKRRMELFYLDRQMELCGGSMAKAAEALDILPNNLSRRLSELRRGKQDPE